MSLFSDPSRLTYSALKFSKGFSSVLDIRALQKTISSFQAGNPQTWKHLPTDATQQGGALVVDEANIVRFLHKDSFAGDHAAIDTLENAIEEAKVPLEE